MIHKNKGICWNSHILKRGKEKKSEKFKKNLKRGDIYCIEIINGDPVGLEMDLINCHLETPHPKN